ncbi:MAG: hypothetical protein IPP44_12595 [Ideonella sp.]|nr:hypothetical protein [Ideonella sp.]
MKHHASLPRTIAPGLAIALALLAPLSAMAASAGGAPAQLRCPFGASHAGSAVCITKAEFEITRSRQAALDQDPAQYLRNALVRCDRLVGDDRQDCVARIQGQGSRSGSVEGGGIYRELVTRVVGTPVAPAVAPPIAQPAPPALPDDKKP